MTKFITKEDIERILRKRKPTGADVGTLFVWKGMNKVMLSIKPEEADHTLDNKELEKYEIELFKQDTEKGITNGLDGEFGIFEDYTNMFKNFVKFRKLTSNTEFWRAYTFIKTLTGIELKLQYSLILELAGINTNNPVFGSYETLTKEDTEELEGATSDNGLKSSLYYVSAYNRSLELLQERYKINFNNFRTPIKYLQEELDKLVKQAEKIKEQAQKIEKQKPVRDMERIKAIADKIQSLDYKSLTEIPADREQEAKELLKHRTPILKGDLNQILCVFKPKI